MRSYIKVYGPPLVKAIRALEKIAIELPEVCIMNYFLDDAISVGTNPERMREYFDAYDKLDAIRCSNIISKSGDSLGEYDFFFEWFTNPTNEQVLLLIEKIDEALTDVGVKYTITTK
ncbi:hypothetical protein FJY84_05295 [Candidatus Bathyarchaeota archaeon]|nr:hypothetical protein [Candidatus Bathyarchaeota archaeon]